MWKAFFFSFFFFRNLHRTNKRLTALVFFSLRHSLSPTYDNSPCLPLWRPSCLWQHLPLFPISVSLSRYTHSFSCGWVVLWIHWKESLLMCFCFCYQHFSALSGWKKRRGGWKKTADKDREQKRSHTKRNLNLVWPKWLPNIIFLFLFFLFLKSEWVRSRVHTWLSIEVQLFGAAPRLMSH